MARWESDSRWYEAHVMPDLIGWWTVFRAWGGKGSRRGGSKIELVADEAAGEERLAAIDTQRRARHYRRVD
jgi:hypothetical protein